MGSLSRQPLWVKLLITFAACAAMIIGPLRYYIQVRHAGYYFPGNYELAITWYVVAMFCSGLTLAAVTIWHVLAKRHRD